MLAAAVPMVGWPLLNPQQQQQQQQQEEVRSYGNEDDQLADYGGMLFLQQGSPKQSSPDEFPPFLDSEFDGGQNPFQVTGGGVDSSMATNRKLTHNACERDRRRKFNSLYSSLHSLLPQADRHKKLSIPSTVSHVLKYIPELQKQVQQLTRRKEEMLWRITRQAPGTGCLTGDNGRQAIYPVVSAVCVGDREVMVQICSLSSTIHCSLSTVVAFLEREGLHLLHASTSHIDSGRIFYHLHLQAKDTISTEHLMFTKNVKNMLREQLGVGSTAQGYM